MCDDITEKLSTYKIAEETILYLKNENLPISINSIVEYSKILYKNGISRSTLIQNKSVYSLYLNNRSWIKKKNKLDRKLDYIFKNTQVESNRSNENRVHFLETFKKSELIT